MLDWLLARLRAIRVRRRAQLELDEELRFHVEMETRANLAAGMTPGEARRVALVQLGGHLQTKGAVGDNLRMPLESCWQDLRGAARSLRHSPGFTLAAVVTLAVGIGANTGIFTLTSALWLRPVAVEAPEHLAVFYSRMGTARNQPGGTATWTLAGDTYRWTDLDALQRDSMSFASVAAEGNPVSEAMLPRLAFPGAPPLVATPVSWNYFRTLGVPVRGRDFAEDDDAPGAAAVAIVSDALWRSRFEADPAVIGRTLRAGDRPVVIIGIAAPRFRGPRLGDQVDAWLPLNTAGEFLPNIPPAVFRRMRQAMMPLRLYGRLRPGVTLEQAETDAQRLDPKGRLFLKTLAASAYPTRAQDKEVQDRRLATLVATTAVFVLLIGCANLAGLLLARAERRRHEMAVRLALGASRARLIRLVAGEAVLVAAIGGAAALAVSRLFLHSVSLFALPTGIPIAGLDLSSDWRVLAFTAALSLGTVAVCGLAPAWHATRSNLTGLLAASRTPSRRPRHGGRAVLLGAHGAMALVLLVGTGLLARSVRNAFDTDLGFASAHTASVLIVPNLARYADATFENVDFARRRADYERLKAQIGDLPGVRLATEGQTPLFSPLAEGERPAPRAIGSGGVLRELPIGTLSGGAGYCSALGVPIVAGRDIAPGDTIPGAPPVAVVSEQLARLLWAGESPLGRRFSLPQRTAASAGAANRVNPATAPPAPDDIEVVGVAAGDAVRRGVRGSNVATIYLPSVRDPADEMMRPAYGLVVRTEAPAETTVTQIEKVARDVFPDAYTLSVTTPSRQVAEQIASERMGLTFFTWFSVVAVGLGVLGIWGLVAHAAASRTFELGVRAALGASPRALVWTVALGGIVPVAVGCLAGLVATAGSTRLLASYLFGVSALDPLTLAGCTALLLMTGLVASLLPARRVLRLDPVAALRTQ